MRYALVLLTLLCGCAGNPIDTCRESGGVPVAVITDDEVSITCVHEHALAQE